jgi:VWFA-related protein
VKTHYSNAFKVFLLTIAVSLPSARSAVSQIRAQVDLVVVPVNIRDSGGKLVTGLKKDDFTIYEDGKLQKISQFDIDPQPLSAAILIDDGMSATMLRRLFPKGSPPLWVTLMAGFGPNDEMIAFRYDHEVHKLSDFTNDSAAIEESFREIAKFIEVRPNDPTDVLGERGPGFLRSIIKVLEWGHGDGGGGGDDGGIKTPNTTIPAQPSSRRSGSRPSDRVMHDAIYEAAIALQDRPTNRRKIIVIISDGKALGDNVHTLPENTDLLLKNEIQFYGVSMDFATFGSFGLLTNYARATGGDVFPGTSTKSLETAFNQLTEQARYQYVLSYVSNNEAGPLAVFRTIAVNTRSSKLKVTHRKGYTQQPKRQ